MVKTAYDAMLSVLNCNETIEKIKAENNGNTPDLTKSNVVELLADYRELLITEMCNTTLEAFKDK